MNFKEAYPHLMKYWDYEKNTKLPEEIHSGSRIYAVKLKCNKGHEVEKFPNTLKKKDRESGVLNDIYCNKCNNRDVPFALFKDVVPELVKCWDYEKNKSKEIELGEITTTTSRYCYFKCNKGHSVKKKPNDLVKLINKKINCNICSGVVVAEETKLKKTYPEIAKEYCLIKNKEKLSDLSCFSDKKVWWLCENNHYWENSISARTGNK
jgi:hypothetical protein